MSVKNFTRAAAIAVLTLSATTAAIAVIPTLDELTQVRALGQVSTVQAMRTAGGNSTATGSNIVNAFTTLRSSIVDTFTNFNAVRTAATSAASVGNIPAIATAIPVATATTPVETMNRYLIRMAFRKLSSNAAGNYAGTFTAANRLGNGTNATALAGGTVTENNATWADITKFLMLVNID